MGRWRRVAARVLGGLALLLIAVLGGTSLGRYLLRAGWEEAKILAARRGIAELAADTTVDSALRAKLQLVLEARAFAVDSLESPAKQAFTQFTQLERDTLVLVLSGARRDALEPKLWRFPVVGRLPYKGYFSRDDALAAEQALANEGYDTYLRPASAFSTLGWFNDPLLSTTVRMDSVDLVNTVIHELTHNRYFAKGDATFNESFANFVGARGAERFFLARGDSVRARAAVDRWADERVLGAFWGMLYRTLDSSFNANPGDANVDRRLALRDSIYRRARATLVDSIAPQLKIFSPLYAKNARLDNAALLARRVYLSDLDAFERALMQRRGDLRGTIRDVIAEHEGQAR